jgi:hypothetical protein
MEPSSLEGFGPVKNKPRTLQEEAADLRRPQKHTYDWYRRVDRLLDKAAAMKPTRPIEG